MIEAQRSICFLKGVSVAPPPHPPVLFRSSYSEWWFLAFILQASQEVFRNKHLINEYIGKPVGLACGMVAGKSWRNGFTPPTRPRAGLWVKGCMLVLERAWHWDSAEGRARPDTGICLTEESRTLEIRGYEHVQINQSAPGKPSPMATALPPSSVEICPIAGFC